MISFKAFRLFRAILLVITSPVLGAAAFQVADVGVKVLDDGGMPVPTAIVDMGISDSRGQTAHGRTDTNGIFMAHFKMVGSLYVRVAKDGYYQTSGYPWSGPEIGVQYPSVNVYTVELKCVRNPVVMPLRNFNAKMPRFDETIALDIEKADWVAPYGTGVTKDILVLAHYRNGGARDYEKRLELSFANPCDGLLPFDGPNELSLQVASTLPVPQLAPHDGYATSWVATRARKPNFPPQFNQKEMNRQYIFRVRSRTNAGGEIVAANYGWILGDFDLSGPTIELKMHYYFNPDPHSRSLEPEDLTKRQ